MRHLWIGFALFATSLAAQSNAERIVNDRYTRSHDYDLLHQRIELGGFDWDSLALDGKVTTTLVARRQGMDSVLLDAGAGLAIRAVTLPGGAALRYTHRDDTLAVRLPRPAAFGDTLRFVTTYHARIESGKGLTFIRGEPGRRHRPQQIWSMGQTENNHHWFPTYDFPDDKATWELVATVPAIYTAVSNGRLVSDRKGRDGSRTMHWSQERPSSTYLVSLVVAPLVRVRDRWRDVPLDYFVYPEDSALARPLFGVTRDQMEVFSRLTGVRYPWAKYAQTTVADFFGGMENVSAATLVDWLPDERAYVDRPWYHRVLIAHELAHQWFGDLVTVKNWANMWLNEGFAQFMPGRYWAEKEGPHAAEDLSLDDYQQYLGIDSRRRMPLASLGSNNIYPKGALVLEMLHGYLGPERFWAAVNRYLTRHAYDNATSDDLRQAVLDAAGENLDWFWSQWVYQAGHPELEVTQSYDSTARRLTLVVRQTQADTATADSTGLRFEVPRAFRMPVAIRVGTARGDVVRQVQIEARTDTVTIDDLPGPPTMVVFDDRNAVLKTLRFDQPTPWLAEQLARASHLWSRDWAIGALAERTDDSLAATALGRAARSSDHPRTRATAAAALARFPAPAARPVLLAAARDTSARVRDAAIASLGVLGPDSAALAAIRQAWERDPSYEVRASALSAAAALDAARRRDLIRQGLGTPSYRDVIQSAALLALVRYPDSTLVSEVEARLGDQDLVALALGALSTRGVEPAGATLARRLDDPRGWVREWVLEAFRTTMPPETALARLRGARTTIARPEARRAVDALVAELEPAGRDSVRGGNGS